MAAIRGEMKDLVYIQVILNGRGIKAWPGTPLHINKKLLRNGIIHPSVDVTTGTAQQGIHRQSDIGRGKEDELGSPNV